MISFLPRPARFGVMAAELDYHPPLTRSSTVIFSLVVLRVTSPSLSEFCSVLCKSFQSCAHLRGP